MENNRLIRMTTIVALLLLIPFIAMQFTDEVNWALADFAIAAVLLFATGLLLEWSIRKVSKMEHRVFIGIAILAGFLLLWAELAVGIFGTPFAGT